MPPPESVAAQTAIQQNLKWSSAKHGATFTQSKLALPPSKKYLVLTCMDARIDPAKAFGIDLGEAHVIRNTTGSPRQYTAHDHFTDIPIHPSIQAGGCAEDALRSIVISQQLLGTNEVLLVKHTGCGMLTFRNEDAYKVIEGNLGSAAAGELRMHNMNFMPFPDLEKAVMDDIMYLERSKLIPSDIVLSGWVYDVDSGKTKKIC
ncbi:uncharacterized protein MKZ38_002563 [Zalerion maritima]|uniref:Carbonic anhydrase n=1 Tax=Zalerion maritima TaxID=339359 RepID=A0AAD5RNN3_9PEZI|nr:uncharacterized protein MKZ38_002563 [Zalerion maritima]